MRVVFEAEDQALKLKLIVYVFNWLLAAGTLRTEELVVVIFAVRQPVLLVEVVRIEGLRALGALEALRVVVVAHRRDVVVLGEVWVGD